LIMCFRVGILIFGLLDKNYCDIIVKKFTKIRSFGPCFRMPIKSITSFLKKF